MIKVNAIGDTCPIPVIKTKKAIQEAAGQGTIEVLVDSRYDEVVELIDKDEFMGGVASGFDKETNIVVATV